MRALQIGTAMRPMPGETLSGDQIAIVRGVAATTVAVIDGLGHGPEAAAVALRAVAVVEQSGDMPLGDLLRTCHGALLHSRGAAITIVRVTNGGLLSHVAVGNVEVKTQCRARFSLLCAPGVVGSRFRKVLETQHQVSSGDRLVMYTDGISSTLALDPLRELDAASAAREILARHAKAHDDAGCAVLDC